MGTISYNIFADKSTNIKQQHITTVPREYKTPIPCDRSIPSHNAVGFSRSILVQGLNVPKFQVTISTRRYHVTIQCGGQGDAVYCRKDMKARINLQILVDMATILYET